jgi:hypothetical protein
MRFIQRILGWRNYALTRFLALAMVTMLSAACSGGGETDAPNVQPAPGPSPAPATLYQSPQAFTAAALDGYVVRPSYGLGDGAYTRAVTVLVRYPAEAAGKLPLVVWSHGGALKDDGKNQNEEWGTSLARAGYIVVHMSHTVPSSTELTQLAKEFGVAESALNDTVVANIVRPRDAIAVLNDLPNIERAFPELSGKIDYEKIGVGGHSRGAYTVRTVACARIELLGNPDYGFLTPAPTNTPLAIQPKAFLANSPQGPGRFGFKDDSWRECTRPDLTQTGDGDITEEVPADRIKPFDLMPAGDKFKMYIADPNTSHETFNLRNTAQPQFVDYVRSTGIAFFDAYLKGLPAARDYLTSGRLEQVSTNKAVVTARLAGATAPKPVFSLSSTIGTASGEPESSSVLDLDGDGALDLLIAANDILYSARNTGGVFSVQTRWNSDASSPAKGFGLFDFDSDGRLDPFIARANATGAQTGDASINNGDGTLSFGNRGNEVVGASRTAVFADFDGDGLTDSFHTTSAFLQLHAPAELHRGISGGNFDPANLIPSAIAAPFWTTRVSAPGTPCDGETWSYAQFKGAIARDIDGDTKPDLVFVAFPDAGSADPRCKTFDQQFKRLNSYRGVFVLRNISTPGQIRFEDASALAIGPNANCPTASCNNYYTPLPLDFDRDGDLDLVLGGLYVDSTADTPLLTVLRNDSTPGQIRFFDISSQSASVATLNALPVVEKDKYRFAEGVPLDYDNDGLIDFAFGIRNDGGNDQGVGFVHLFRGLGNGRFELVDRMESGIPLYANSLSYGDFDGDGSLDLVANDKFFTGRTYVYRNAIAAGTRWVGVELRRANGTWALEDKVTVLSTAGAILGHDEVRTDYSYRSKRTPILHFGLGSGVSTVDVRVTRRDGSQQIFPGLATGRVNKLTLN